MNPWLFALWGAFGGLAVEAIQFYGAIKRSGDWPWKIEGEPGRGPLAVSAAICVGLGFGVAWAAALTGQVSGPLGGIAVGVAAPLLLEQMARQVPIDAKSSVEQGGSGAR